MATLRFSIKPLIIDPPKKFGKTLHSLGPSKDAKVERLMGLVKEDVEKRIALATCVIVTPPLLDDVVSVSRTAAGIKIQILPPEPSKAHLLDKLLAHYGVLDEFQKHRSAFAGQDVLVDTPLGDLKAYSLADVPAKGKGEVKHSGVKRPDY